mmetsp:Transcript_49467/g.140298  ORF Transcript_49467/g.140298 Transcript_49467/m.140298 type:complete len:201 (-) Transcript_49467:146-748(-)
MVGHLGRALRLRFGTCSPGWVALGPRRAALSAGDGGRGLAWPRLRAWRGRLQQRHALVCPARNRDIPDVVEREAQQASCSDEPNGCRPGHFDAAAVHLAPTYCRRHAGLSQFAAQMVPAWLRHDLHLVEISQSTLRRHLLVGRPAGGGRGACGPGRALDGAARLRPCSAPVGRHQPRGPGLRPHTHDLAPRGGVVRRFSG